MKQSPQLIFLVILIQAACICKAQVTKLSNNTNLELGLTIASNTLIKSVNDSLWITDGTPSGTMKYASNVAFDPADQFTLYLGKIFFAGTTAANGSELWVTDGTAPGTFIVKDIESGAGSGSPRSFFVYNGLLYFFANTTAAGVELWKTDGTDPGTVLVKDINPTGNSYNNNPGFIIANNILYFTANDGTNGSELWRTDGTLGGTMLVKDINTGPGSSNFIGLLNSKPLGTDLIFAATNPSNGQELWKTDGTTVGTVMIKDIFPGFVGSSPNFFLLFNGKIYFNALDPINGIEFWVTDGTPGGTNLVLDIDPGFNSSVPNLFDAVIINNKFYFPAQTTADGMELWSSDGTPGGTMLFKDFNPGSAGSNPFILFDFFGITNAEQIHTNLFNGKIFIEADDGTNGSELWITDGTPGGTVMVKDVNPGSGSGINLNSFNYFYTQSFFYFAGDDGVTGVELWKSDGTNLATARAADINPGMPSSAPSFIALLNNRVLFTADDGDNINADRDLFVIDQASTPVYLLNFSASPYGKSVQVKWTTTSEINSSHFEIQRSKNGIQFENISTLPAANNSSLNKTYQYIDVEALLSGVDKLFYRLKMVDNDDRFLYSKVAVVNITPDPRLFYTYPNPANNQLLVIVKNQNAKKIAIRITDQNGKAIYNRQLDNLRGISQYNINIASLAKGVYYIQLITKGKLQSAKFVKN